MTITPHPDEDYFKKRKKEIKANNGYCKSMPQRGKGCKCICKQFLEQDKSGWCPEGLYYKTIEEDK